MTRVKQIIIDYEKKLVKVDFVKDTNLPSGTHYTPFQHYPIIVGSPHFLNFDERQRETNDWIKLKHNFADIKKDIEFAIKLCNTHQLELKPLGLDKFSVTYAFDFGNAVEQKYGG